MYSLFGLKPQSLKDLQFAFDEEDDELFEYICDENNISQDAVEIMCKDFLPQGCFLPNNPWDNGEDINWPSVASWNN